MSRQPSLFASGFIARKTSETTGEELAKAADARAEQEKKQVEQIAAAAAAKLARDNAPKAAGKRPLSRDPEAVRSRLKRMKKKKAKLGKAKPRDKAAADAEKAEAAGAAKAASAEFENETHYIDARGRKRKRKKLRSIAAPSGGTGAKGSRVFNATEKEIILQEHARVKAKTMGSVSYSDVARQLQQNHTSLFGASAPGMGGSGITRQAVRQARPQEKLSIQLLAAQ